MLKLTEGEVRSIRKLREEKGNTLGEIQAKYPYVTRENIWKIVTRQTWKHVE